jgi:hypothetical protein
MRWRTPHDAAPSLSHLEASRALLGLAAAARGALTLNRNGNDGLAHDLGAAFCLGVFLESGDNIQLAFKLF